MRNHRITQLGLMLTLATFLCEANVIAQSGGIAGAVGGSTLIVVARLDQFIAEPESVDRMVQEKMRSSTGIAGGNVEMMVMSTVNPRGTYVFTPISILKGTSPKPLIVRLPRVTSGSLMGAGGAGSIPLKANYLLMLSGTEQTGFAPTFSAPIQISAAIVLPKAPIDQSVPGKTADAVIQLFIDSLAESETRHGAAQMLTSIVSEKVAAVMRKYLNDPDDAMRSCAISCLATNQDVTVIPLIANWKFSDPNRSGNGLLTNLSKFKTPDAIPYLSELLLDKTSVYIPENAASALRQLPLDKSTVPYWMQVIHTPARGIGGVSYHAYYYMHMLYPELGAPGNVTYYRDNRDAEIAKLDAWWADEQAGKHAPPADKK